MSMKCLTYNVLILESMFNNRNIALYAVSHTIATLYSVSCFMFEFSYCSSCNNS